MWKWFFIIAWCLLPGLAVQAQQPAIFKTPCDKIVAMGLDRWMETFDKATNDSSTAGQKGAFWRYAECKAAANARIAATLPSQRRQRFEQMRRDLEKFENILWGLVEMRAGGGTMYGLFATAAYATRANWVESALKTTQHAERSAVARRQANADFAKLQKVLLPYLVAPSLDFSGAHSPTEQRKIYREMATEARALASQLQTQSGHLPDKVAALLARRLVERVHRTFETT